VKAKEKTKAKGGGEDILVVKNDERPKGVVIKNLR